MLARVSTFSLDGLDARPVTVEVDVRQGLPAFAVVGLGDLAVRESRERVRAALQNCGFEFPQRRIVANLAPAHLRKTGSGFDLAIACGILAASGQLPVEALSRLVVFAELSLAGELRGCRGTLSVAEAAGRRGFDGIVVARERAREAALVEGVRVLGLDGLRHVARVLAGEEPPDVEAAVSEIPDSGGELSHEPDLGDVRGHAVPIAALAIAAAGAHNLLMTGPPGTGKSMLAQRLPSILPPLRREEAIEVTRIHSVAGRYRGDGLIAQRPFRSPHHAISASALVGGGPGPSPGETSLAHRGVLFLDELSEFTRPAVEALRQPMEDGRVVVVRGQRTAVFPTRFQLVAATNPCPCGHRGAVDRCRCSEADFRRHARRLTGPLLDRIDLHIEVERPSALALAGGPTATSDQVRDTVLEARERQVARLESTGVSCNAHMDARLVRRFAALDAEGAEVLAASYRKGLLSARGRERVLKVARTIADLDGAENVRPADVHQALSYRSVRVDAREREAVAG